jgi:hypothetical protein
MHHTIYTVAQLNFVRPYFCMDTMTLRESFDGLRLGIQSSLAKLHGHIVSKCNLHYLCGITTNWEALYDV